MATETQIANQALVILGASPISSLNATDEVNAVTLNTVFDDTRDALIRIYRPKFATRRVSITANATSPAFGRANAFDLPDDYLELLPRYPEDRLEYTDWIREGNQIVTDDDSPLQIRYTAQVTDTSEFDSTFVKMLASALAMECAEKITQSTSKWERASAMFDAAVSAGRKASSFEQVNPLPAEDSWVSIRFRGMDNTRSWHG